MFIKFSTVVGYIDGAQPGFIALTDGSCACSNITVNVFGKNGPNEICLEAFFSATHFETLKFIQKHSQCSLKRLQRSPAEIETLYTIEKSFQNTFTIVDKRHEFFSALGYIPTVLSRVEFGRVLLQLTRISRALFQNIKILRKFP